MTCFVNSKARLCPWEVLHHKCLKPSTSVSRVKSTMSSLFLHFQNVVHPLGTRAGRVKPLTSCSAACWRHTDGPPNGQRTLTPPQHIACRLCRTDCRRLCSTSRSPVQISSAPKISWTMHPNISHQRCSISIGESSQRISDPFGGLEVGSLGRQRRMVLRQRKRLHVSNQLGHTCAGHSQC